MANHWSRPVDGLPSTRQLRPGDLVRGACTLPLQDGAELGLVQVIVYDGASGLPPGSPVDLQAPW